MTVKPMTNGRARLTLLMLLATLPLGSCAYGPSNSVGMAARAQPKQNEGDVEGPCRQAVGAVSRQHVQEVCCVSEHRIRLNRAAARIQPPHRRHQCAELRRQSHGLPGIGLR